MIWVSAAMIVGRLVQRVKWQAAVNLAGYRQALGAVP